MRLIKIDGSTNTILKSNFEICYIDNLTRKEIIKLYPGRDNGAYYLDKFIKHLKGKHNISIKEYLKKYFEYNWPKCPVKNGELGYKTGGKGIKISQFNAGAVNKENCEAFACGCKKMSEARKGKNNPMFGGPMEQGN